MSGSSPAAEEPAVVPPRPRVGRLRELRQHLPGLPQAFSSLLQTVVVALFVVSFVAQPLLIPSESMEHTLLVGDFLLFNKQMYAKPGPIGRWLLPYRSPARGDIAIFRHPYPPMLIKRVVAVPGDRLRVVDGRVFINGVALNEPYATFEPA
ncbi:MAG: signal peptidase I, partial [Terracidiphilus sp.]